MGVSGQRGTDSDGCIVVAPSFSCSSASELKVIERRRRSVGQPIASHITHRSTPKTEADCNAVGICNGHCTFSLLILVGSVNSADCPPRTNCRVAGRDVNAGYCRVGDSTAIVVVVARAPINTVALG